MDNGSTPLETDAGNLFPVTPCAEFFDGVVEFAPADYVDRTFSLPK